MGSGGPRRWRLPKRVWTRVSPPPRKIAALAEAAAARDAAVEAAVKSAEADKAAALAEASEAAAAA